MSTKHTPEPWAISSTEPHEVRSHPIYGRAVAYTIVHGIPDDVKTANAERIVSCVNACAGIEDPAAAIREAVLAMDGILHSQIAIIPARHRAKLESALAKLQPKGAK